MSARLLEKSWHHLEHWIYSVAKTHKERRAARTIAKTQLRGRAPSYTRWGSWVTLVLLFYTSVGWSLVFPPSKSILHPSPPCPVPLETDL